MILGFCALFFLASYLEACLAFLTIFFVGVFYQMSYGIPIQSTYLSAVVLALIALWIWCTVVAYTTHK